MEISDDYVKEGRKSLKLDYDFTKMTDQSIAFVNFGDEKEGLTLEGKPEAIGMWVYGDGKEHWLRCRIKDANGTESKLTFADKVDWKGWKWVTADIPAGISYPVKLNNIYLAEINESRKDSGTIYIDNLRLMYEPNDKNLGLRAETKFIDPMDVSSVLNFDEKLIITTDGKESVSPDGKIICFDGIVTNGSMSASDAVMWNNIKSFADYEDKVLVLSMNKSIYSISDVREIEILKSILKKASEKNDVFVVWKGKAESTFMEDGIRYVTYDDSFEIGTDGTVSYKN
jgi:hypothetical protein